MKHNCLNCKKEFRTYPCRIKVGGGKYCSKKCADKAMIGSSGYWTGKKRPDLIKTKSIETMFKKGQAVWNKGKTIKIAKPCRGCGKVILVYPNRVERTKYCSSECKSKYSPFSKTKVICPECGINFIQKRSKLCRSCANIGIERPFCAGINNWRWKGGITTENQKIRHSMEYNQWRRLVFRRDNFKCQFCGQVGGKLQADHIKPFNAFLELRFDVSNGRTLCIECHKKTPTYLVGGRYLYATK
jgi:5-methylcytosine-specific restriction endonuclease McrA